MNFEPLSKRPMRVLERPTDVECLSKNPARTTPGYADESYSKEFSLSSVFYASFLDHMYRRRNEQVMAKPTNLNFMSTPISNCRNSILFIRLPSIVLGLPPLNPCPHFVKPIKLLPKSELPPGQYHHFRLTSRVTSSPTKSTTFGRSSRVTCFNWPTGVLQTHQAFCPNNRAQVLPAVLNQRAYQIC